MTHARGDEPERDGDRARLLGQTDRYAALPKPTRVFVENLHDDDLDNLGKLIGLMRQKGFDRIKTGVEMAESVQTLGRVSRWVLLTAFALFTSVAGLVAAWRELWPSMRPGGHG